LKLSRIGQIAIPVRDVARAIAFYRDVLGMEFLFEVPGMGFFDCEGIRLMLAQSQDPGSVPCGATLYYGVSDLPSAFETLSQSGVTFVSNPRKIADIGSHELWMAFFRDPDGNLLGLMSEIPRAG